MSEPPVSLSSTRQSAERPARWERDMRLVPPLNALVLAFMEGTRAHSEANWTRQGYALMVRHQGGWSTFHMEDACKRLDADDLRVTAWLLLENPHGDC